MEPDRVDPSNLPDVSRTGHPPRPAALQCQSLTVGNSSFRSRFDMCLNDVRGVPGGLEIDVSVENVPLIGGGFFWDPIIDIRVDGSVVETLEISLGLGERITETIVVEGLSPGEHTVEVAQVGVLSSISPCWCIGDGELSCDIDQPSGDCIVSTATATVPSSDGGDGGSQPPAEAGVPPLLVVGVAGAGLWWLYRRR